MTILNYRTKPVDIQAIEWSGLNYEEIEIFTNAACFRAVKDGGTLYIKTLEGDFKASIGDFIIKGLGGEFYPCKPSIFHKKYNELKSVERT